MLPTCSPPGRRSGNSARPSFTSATAAIGAPRRRRTPGTAHATKIAELRIKSVTRGFTGTNCRPTCRRKPARCNESHRDRGAPGCDTEHHTILRNPNHRSTAGNIASRQPERRPGNLHTRKIRQRTAALRRQIVAPLMVHHHRTARSQHRRRSLMPRLWTLPPASHPRRRSHHSCCCPRYLQAFALRPSTRPASRRTWPSEVEQVARGSPEQAKAASLDLSSYPHRLCGGRLQPCA